MNILLVRKSNCTFCDEAMKFLINSGHRVAVMECNKRFDKFPKDIKFTPRVVFSFKNYIVLPRAITDSTICINFHPGPPEHPGSCAANWALYNEDKSFGVTAHFMNGLVDNGLIFRVRRFPMEPDLDSLLLKADKEVLKLFKEVVGDMTTTWVGKARRGKELDELIARTPDSPRLQKAIKRKNIL